MLTRTGQIALLASLVGVCLLWLGIVLYPWAARRLAWASMPMPLAARAEDRRSPDGHLVADAHGHAATLRPEDAVHPSAPRPRGSADSPPRNTRTISMLVTAYCPCRRCCGRYSDGRTASGRSIRADGSMFVAADTRLLPFGTRVSVPGYHGGAPVSVLDRGAKIKGDRLDVFFLSHARAKAWGARRLDVTVYSPRPGLENTQDGDRP